MRATGFFVFFLFSGVGCSSVSFFPQTFSRSPEEAAASAVLAPGSSLTIRRTVFGLSGLDEIFSKEKEERLLTMTAWSPGVSAAFEWKKDSASETPAGVLSTTALAEGERILLPVSWPEGNQSFSDNTLVWLSKKQYQDLVGAGSTNLSIGFFDERLASVLQVRDTVQNVLNALQKKAQEASSSQDVYKLEVAPGWHNYRISVNGMPTVVRTIEAANWFGSYIILANPDNPLLLKVTLNPISFGNVPSLSSQDVAKSFLGYEITEIKL